MKKIQPILDKILGLTVSKKLSVWIVGTVMVFLHKDIPDNWLILSGIYLGIQGVIDILREKVKASAVNYDNQNYIEDENSYNNQI